MNRRGFYKSLLGHTVVLHDELEGRPQRRLSELPSLDPRERDRLCPCVSEEIEIVPAAHQVRARWRGEREEFVLFEIDAARLRAFNMFDGCNSLGAIKRDLVSDDLKIEDATACVDELFLRLLDMGVCEPSNV